jgi:ATP phosphoribosyltransferase regulatory subunit
MTTTKKILLPQGFHDHLPPQAQAEVKLNAIVVNSLNQFGYELVRPALMEYEESLDKEFTSDFFKVTDTLSGKMMVIRNDITPQIARIAKDRFGETAKNQTLRLSYSGQVIKKNATGKFTERQLTQAGFELIGDYSAEKDAEIIYVIVETLENLNLKNYTIDFCYPKLSEILLSEKDFSKKEQAEIFEAIETKDIALLNSKDLSDIVTIIKTTDEACDILSAIKALKTLTEKINLVKAVEVFAKIIAVLEILQKSDVKINLSLNILEKMGFAYHDGLCYSVISGKNYEEIGKGGRYKISLAKNEFIQAAGFTFFINSIMRSENFESKIEQKNISYKEGFAKSKALRKNGVTTVFE